MSHPIRRTCERLSSQIEEKLLRANILSRGKTLLDFMRTNKLAQKDESVYGVFDRATRFLAEAGAPFYGESQVGAFHRRFMNHVCKFEVVLGSPILTNAGRRESKSISACSIPPIWLSKTTREDIRKIVGSYHERGMGTGFSLDDLEDPVEMIKYLNSIAIQEVQAGKIERSCGNMGVLSIDHPRILEFIRIKIDNPEIKEWKFNLSVNITDAFMKALSEQTSIHIGGKNVDPNILMEQIATCAHESGDPGVVFMDRINRLNRVPDLGTYRTVVPCGETSLFDGEVCQFAYINLTRFIEGENINLDLLREAIHSTAILLDNAVEGNIQRMPNPESAEIISSVRRIGIGVCGFADVLQALSIPYASPKGREFAANLMSFINFESKSASVDLAKERGPFRLFDSPKTKKELFIAPFKQHPTGFVPAQKWEELEIRFREFKIRNIATTILPPSGRTSILAGVSPSIEPPFRLTVDADFETYLTKQCQRFNYPNRLGPIFDEVRSTGSVQKTDLPEEVKDVFRPALEISPEDHLLMTATFQMFTDEGISKTVNMPNQATTGDVQKIFSSAYHLNLKGVTIYRDNCRTFQPKAMHTNQNTLIDSIYGPIFISPKILKILSSPLFQRLKKIHQNGTNFLVDKRQSTTRYEHTVGAMALVRILNGDETAQVGALLHDVSHAPFSHVFDLVLENAEQDFHEKIKREFLQSPEAAQAIRDCGITSNELENDTLYMKKEKGCLNVDRLDYAIRDLKAVNRLYQPEWSSILNGLVIEGGEINCKNIQTAQLIFEKFLEANLEIYFEPKSEAAALAFSSIIKLMLKEGRISEKEAFSTDDLLIEKVLASPYRDLYLAIGPGMKFEVSQTPTHLPPILRKLRYINPRILGLEGRLTDHCPRSKKRLELYLQTTPQTVYYKIPLLQYV